MTDFITLETLRQLPIAHTDAGDFIFFNGVAKSEFLVLGKIIKKRAGLFFLEIEGEKFTVNANSKFNLGDKVACVLRSNIVEGRVEFIVSGLETILK